MNRDDFIMINDNLIYFDNGATTLKPKCVIDKINDYYTKYCANAHRGDYHISQIVDNLYEGVREKIKDFIHAKEKSEIVFTSGATDGLNRIVFGYFKDKLKEGDEVLLSLSEHASNILPWFELKKEIGIVIKYIDLNSNNEITMDNLKKAITEKTKVISLAYITNVIGDTRPIKEICKYAHQKDILVVVDGAQSISHYNTNVMDDDIDFFVASAHKFYGPTGTGFLYGKFNLLEQMKPLFYGGGMNAIYLKDGYMELREVPTRFEAGTQNIAGIIGMGTAIDYINNIGINNIIKHENNLKEYLISKLKELDNVIIYNEKVKGNIVSFNIKDIFSQDVSVYLDKYNICIRSGNHCSKILNNTLGVDNTCRISFGIYNTKEEIDKLLDALKNISNIWKEIL